ncbi:hypothetical protein [Ralstonia pseudosolanacearum]|uniref:hypothetical protein n=1 Tax=Ralstonia pseudosolanacearum TaxID=1310165 RepID=UPI001FF7E199|nr:hypothetical protein [Ralstonia pseudosolanacearum]
MMRKSRLQRKPSFLCSIQHTQATGAQAGGTQGAVIAPMRECGLANCGGYGKALLNPVKRQCGFRCAHQQYVRAHRQDEIGNQALDRTFRKKYRVGANAMHAGNPMNESGLKKTEESAWNHCCPL